jgi:hypothetical protein
MSRESILSEIDREIAQLQEVRSILAGGTTISKKNRGSKATAAPSAAPRKRTLSPEARARIAAAQKRRWAAEKKSA